MDGGTFFNIGSFLPFFSGWVNHHAGTVGFDRTETEFLLSSFQSFFVGESSFYVGFMSGFSSTKFTIQPDKLLFLCEVFQHFDLSFRQFNIQLCLLNRKFLFFDLQFAGKFAAPHHLRVFFPIRGVQQT